MLVNRNENRVFRNEQHMPSYSTEDHNFDAIDSDQETKPSSVNSTHRYKMDTSDKGKERCFMRIIMIYDGQGSIFNDASNMICLSSYQVYFSSATYYNPETHVHDIFILHSRWYMMGR
jgi:hypothetical protein